ncbi:unnamed protein product [Pedinophyceae sp. YPF-701]|nr:unnamed protein product [Pedinophyceae sp. YPF-701]
MLSQAGRRVRGLALPGPLRMMSVVSESAIDRSRIGPMDSMLGSAHVAPKEAHPATRPAPKVTTLANGARVAAEDTPNPNAALALVVNAGSCYETPASYGASQTLQHLAFRCTKHRMHLSTVREMEAIGARTSCAATREHLVYMVEAPRPFVREAMELLCDTAMNPDFSSAVARSDATAMMTREVDAVKGDARMQIMEELQRRAFRGPLGNPMYTGMVPTAQALEAFHAQLFTAGSVVVGGSGVAQDEIVTAAEPMLAALPQAPPPALPPSTYVGGDYSQFSAAPEAHVFVGLGIEGGWRNLERAVKQTVISHLMGSGASFSSGGPGKGMHSRLYRNVLEGAAHLGVSSASYEMACHDDMGFAGVYVAGASVNADKLADIAVKEMLALGSGVTEEELERAKRMALSTTKMMLETPAVVAEDVAKNLATWGRIPEVKEYEDMINKLTLKDIAAELKAMSATPLTYSAVGPLSSFPSYTQVAKAFSK